MTRQNISSGTPWEARFGYSRAVRVDDRIVVAGTIAVDDQGKLLHPQDAAAQANIILDRIESALAEAGSNLKEVVSLRTYITSMANAEDIGLTFKERLGDTAPVSTMVVVAALFADALVEIEAEAILKSGL
ncbi:MAG: RidA family protein [Planctomycetota bacterium]|nr:RidA family protein [Planctomycetota bacterium]